MSRSAPSKLVQMRHMGHSDVTVVLHAKGSLYVLQMLSTSHIVLQSNMSHALGPPLLSTTKFLLPGPLSSASVLTWKGLQACDVLQQELKDKMCIHVFKAMS